jgi:hypothetical protein
MTLSGIEHVTYRLVEQCLKNWATACPNTEKATGEITDCPAKIRFRSILDKGTT